jgi:D-glycero-beta-D-manno-heptose 1-phosphate adenylyltransferase
MSAGKNPPSDRAAGLPERPADKIVSLEEAIDFARERQARGQTVVFCNGCFDILHAGHISYLNDARAEGDALIVGVNSDASERAIKGPDRPVMAGVERAELVAGMEAVDRVVIFEEPDVERCLREIRPDVHAKGTDYTAESVPERWIADELGIRVAITGAPKTNASKQIMRAIRDKAAG